MNLIDSHCHLHDSQFFPDNREEIYQKSFDLGVGIIVVGTDARSSREAVEFALSHRNAWAVLGVHPHDSKDGVGEISGILAENRDQIGKKIVGIGEIGLDYFYMNSPRGIQIRGLEEQLQLAIDYHLPVSFHIRDAFDDFWPIFANFPGLQGVMHSFTDSWENLEKGLSNGLFVGINGISTFTRDKSQQELYQNAPLDRILLETDAPFLTPKPFRGTMNEPRFVELVARYQAEVRNIPYDDIRLATLSNTKRLFKI